MTARFSTGISRSMRYPAGMSYNDVFTQGYWVAALHLRDHVIDISYYGSSYANIGHYSKSMSKAWGACALYSPPSPSSGGGRCKMYISTSSRIPWMANGIEAARNGCRSLWIHESAWHFMMWTTAEPPGSPWPMSQTIQNYLIGKYGGARVSTHRQPETLGVTHDDSFLRRLWDRLTGQPRRMLYTFDAREDDVCELCIERGVFQQDDGKRFKDAAEPQFVSFPSQDVPREWKAED